MRLVQIQKVQYKKVRPIFQKASDEMIISVNDLTPPNLHMYSVEKETQLKHYYEPEEGIFIAESPNVIERALDAGYEPISALVCEKDIDKEAAGVVQRLESIDSTFPVYSASFDTFKNITGFGLTRGLLCAMRRKRLPNAGEILSRCSNIAVLENVSNPTNIGAIFRSAAALRADGVLLTYDCCDPLYRRAIRVSMGNVFKLPWAFLPKICGDSCYIEIIKKYGFTTIGMALRENAYKLNDPILKSPGKTAVLLGNEGYGLREETITACDYTCIIPMSDGVDSLNVAAASAVAFWELFKA